MISNNPRLAPTDIRSTFLIGESLRPRALRAPLSRTHFSAPVGKPKPVW